MSEQKSGVKDSVLDKESESDNKLKQNQDKNSKQNNEQSSDQANVSETPIKRKRGRPRKYPINNAPIPDNDNKKTPKSAQSAESPKSEKEKQEASSKLASRDEIQQNNASVNTNNANNNDKIPQKTHHAKAGNILYKNIHSNANNKKVTLNTTNKKLDSILVPSPSPISNPGFNYIVTHSRLETIETRINDNQIPEMIHPAQSIVYDRLHQEPLFLNPKEFEKRKNYRIIHTLKRIPACWEPRPWDREEEKMSKFENLEYAEMIHKFEPIDSNGEIREWYQPKNSKSGTIQKQKMKPIIFEIPLKDFNTDDFDDQTDYDYY